MRGRHQHRLHEHHLFRLMAQLSFNRAFLLKSKYMKKSLSTLVKRLQQENPQNMSGGFNVIKGIRGGVVDPPDNPYCYNATGCRNEGDCSHTDNVAGCTNLKTCAF